MTEKLHPKQIEQILKYWGFSDWSDYKAFMDIAVKSEDMNSVLRERLQAIGGPKF